MDGIDVALLKTDGLAVIEFGPFETFKYSATDKQLIEDALQDAKLIKVRDERPGNLAKVEAMITACHARAVESFLAEHNVNAHDIDVIGFHGQTVLHRPEQGLTVQLGDGQELANKLDVPIVWDMRANDMENNGQGAPLVPVFHQALSKKFPYHETTAFVNIGGISNVTFVRTGYPPVAFDCGPGNALIDQWMTQNTNRSFDENGQLGLQGSVDQSVVDTYLSSPFFDTPYPKSLDRNDFTLAQMPDLSAGDGAATLAAVTAESIARSAHTAGILPDRWIIAGGGARNQAIMKTLASKVVGEVITADAVGLNGDAMEAQCWAYLAVRSLRGLALTFPTTTGCEEACTGGIISAPER